MKYSMKFKTVVHNLDHILFAILTLIYFLLPYGIKVCVDNVNRIISINKVCILYCVYFCCPKKYKIDEIQEFSYEVVEINDDSKEQHLCVNFKDGRGKEIFYKCRTSYFCCFRYDAPIQEVHQKLNSMIYSCGSQGLNLVHYYHKNINRKKNNITKNRIINNVNINYHFNVYCIQI